MSSALARFQDDFSRALRAPPDRIQAAGCGLADQPGFAVYRNTVLKGCLDALRANYPSVARLVGEPWFRDAAAIYTDAYPPRDARLLCFGAQFASFLETFEPAATLPYLPAVAHLDRMWTEAHIAADAATLDPAGLAALAPEVLGGLVLRPHPAAQWAWFADQPIFSIWHRNREGRDDGETPDWRAEGALLTRPRDTVIWNPIDLAGCRFLDACAVGRNLGEAAAAALDAAENTDLAALMAGLCGSGALCIVAPADSSQVN